MRPRDTSPKALDAAIDRIIDAPCSPALVAAYYQENGPFAAATFDLLGQNEPNRIATDDLLAVTLLDVVVRPPAVRDILGGDSAELEQLLGEVPDTVDLWDATPVHLASAEAVWDRLRRYRWLDWVTAGKLLARKRPRLVPIVDSVVVGTIPAPDHGYWDAIRASLQSSDRRQRISALRPPDLPSEVSLLRILDVVVWMQNSRGTNAQQARAVAGC